MLKADYVVYLYMDIYISSKCDQ